MHHFQSFCSSDLPSPQFSSCLMFVLLNTDDLYISYKNSPSIKVRPLAMGHCIFLVTHDRFDALLLLDLIVFHPPKKIPTLPETNIAPTFLLGRPIFKGHVSFREGKIPSVSSDRIFTQFPPGDQDPLTNVKPQGLRVRRHKPLPETNSKST